MDNNKKCLHEGNITYMDLFQQDGTPFYAVKCEDCGEYGTIELNEGDNIFGITKKDILELLELDNKDTKEDKLNTQEKSKANKKITIPISEEDLSSLQNGETFDWTFDGIDVHLKLEDQCDLGNYGFCIDCGENLQEELDIQLCEDCMRDYDVETLWKLHDKGELNALDFNENAKMRKRFYKN